MKKLLTLSGIVALMTAQVSLAQPIGEVDTAGTTWYDYQSNGTSGRMIAVDAEGFVHMVWMNGLDSSIAERHVYYNVWDPGNGEFLFPGGCRVDASPRAGYTSLAVSPDGLAFPAFHATSTEHPDSALGTAGISFLPRDCNFTVATPVPLDPRQYLWPKIASTPDYTLHMVTSEFVMDGGRRINYSRGLPLFDPNGIGIGVDWQDMGGGEQFYSLDTVSTISVDVAASRSSHRVAIGWAHNRDPDYYQVDNDAMIKISEDAGLSWSANLNITSFVAEDAVCCDTAINPRDCPRDTFRLYTDMSLLFDDRDVLHAAFTTSKYLQVQCEFGEPAFTGQSAVWHWSEDTGNFALIASVFYDMTVEGWFADGGAWQLNVQRPSLAMDSTNGWLYCAYMQYDSNCYSNDGYLMADVFVSVSTDNGEHWSVGTNVTRTCPGENIPPPGSMHERDETLAELVTNGTLHLSYVLDHDAGGTPQGEGVRTLNEFIYQRIPVDSIPTTPLIPNYPLHADSTGFVKAGDPSRPAIADQIRLHPAYPNPFNSVTNVAFDLPRNAQVSLTVHDILGRVVEVLYDGRMNAGARHLTWHPSCASGVYFMVLRSGDFRRAQKILLLR